VNDKSALYSPLANWLNTKLWGCNLMNAAMAQESEAIGLA
jgi:hypothetical protein